MEEYDIDITMLEDTMAHLTMKQRRILLSQLVEIRSRFQDIRFRENGKLVTVKAKASDLWPGGQEDEIVDENNVDARARHSRFFNFGSPNLANEMHDLVTNYERLAKHAERTWKDHRRLQKRMNLFLSLFKPSCVFVIVAFSIFVLTDLGHVLVMLR